MQILPRNQPRLSWRFHAKLESTALDDCASVSSTSSRVPAFCSEARPPRTLVTEYLLAITADAAATANRCLPVVAMLLQCSTRKLGFTGRARGTHSRLLARGSSPKLRMTCPNALFPSTIDCLREKQT